MVFSSVEFLFLFLPLVLLGYMALPWLRLRNTWLLAASLIFYYWGERDYTIIMIVSILFNYAAGYLVDIYRSRIKIAKLILTLAITGNLAALAYFKYGGFIVGEMLNPLLRLFSLSVLQRVDIHLPIGISFFTFQAMSYVIDVYRSESKVQKNPLNIGLYVSMFPQLIAGPIVRYHDVAQSIRKRSVSLADFSQGIRIFTVGLGKKVILANTFAAIADGVFELPFDELGTVSAWSGIIAYTLQIYFDFSGYSDMAIGLGHMFGFHFPENFKYPYIAQSIRDFWCRWHISLSTWLRDYLYIPLGGSRGSSLKTYRNLLIVFLLCGLWHGASWNFVVWGIYHGCFLIAERLTSRHLKMRSPAWLQHAYCLLAVMLGWVLFREETLSGAIQFMGVMFGINQGVHAEYHPLAAWWSNLSLYLLPIALLAVTPILPWMKKHIITPDLTRCHPLAAGALSIIPQVLFMVGIWLLSAMLLAKGTYNPFIYFRF